MGRLSEYEHLMMVLADELREIANVANRAALLASRVVKEGADEWIGTEESGRKTNMEGMFDELRKLSYIFEEFGEKGLAINDLETGRIENFERLLDYAIMTGDVYSGDEAQPITDELMAKARSDPGNWTYPLGNAHYFAEELRSEKVENLVGISLLPRCEFLVKKSLCMDGPFGQCEEYRQRLHLIQGKRIEVIGGFVLEYSNGTLPFLKKETNFDFIMITDSASLDRIKLSLSKSIHSHGSAVPDSFPPYPPRSRYHDDHY